MMQCHFVLAVSEQGKESLVMMTHLRDDDMSMTLLAAGDSSENACEGGSESEAVGACAGGDIEGQDNNSNNLVTGAEGDGVVVRDLVTAFSIPSRGTLDHLGGTGPFGGNWTI